MAYLGIEKQGHKEMSLVEWNALKQQLNTHAESEYKRRNIIDNFTNDDEEQCDMRNEEHFNEKLSDTTDVATMKLRLTAAKQEYDYNKSLITMFQAETDQYFEKNRKVTTTARNGAITVIPSVVNLERYIKLNIALSKLISELEGDLNLEEEGGENPFI